MATMAFGARTRAVRDDSFFMVMAFVMAGVVIAGFSLQLAMGRSSFAAPPLVHAHAIVFMGWIVLYVLQNTLAARGSIALHKRLGWIGAGWMVLMAALGCAVTAAMARSGHVPFFFRPLHFLVFDPLNVMTFVGLTTAAIVLRRQTDWHRRLHYCGTVLLLGAPLGRLLPMPLLVPWAYEIDFAVVMIFPAVGVIADWRRTGSVHPAWLWGISVMIGSILLIEVITYSAAGQALYAAVTAGSPGAAVPPLEFAPPPRGPLITGR